MPTTLTFLTPDDNIQQQIDVLAGRIAALESGLPALLRPTRYNAGDNVERFTQLAGTTGGPYKYHALIRLHIGPCAAGDVLLAHGNFQITWAQSFALMIAGFLKVHEGEGPSVAQNATPQTTPHAADWDGEEVSEPQSENFTKTVHHKPVRHTGMITLTRDYADAWLTMIAYSASSSYSGQLIKVDQDHGRLFAVKFPTGYFQLPG